MLPYKQALVTFFGVTLALCACNQKKGQSTVDAPPPTAFAGPATADHSATAWDESGFRAFRQSHPPGADVTSDFLAKYAGLFAEATPMVNGRLEIAGGRMSLSADTNRRSPKQLCRIQMNMPIEAVTSGDTGYVVWIKAGGALRDCLLARVEATDIQKSGPRLGLALDYYNANTLRLSLRDGYVFFLRGG